MSKLKNYSGRYCESDYENAFIGFLEAEGWQYLAGENLKRSGRREVLYEDDLREFLSEQHPTYTAADVQRLVDTVKLVGAVTDFATLHKVYRWMIDGMQFTPDGGHAETVNLIDFGNWHRNKWRVVNQLVIDYQNNGVQANRRPDVLLYINGLPVCVIELKNPADTKATIEDAYQQICTRYWRDIPHLLHYCPLACISDGVKTRLGTVRTPYEHFYSWRRINNEDKIAATAFDELQAMIKGVFQPTRFLEILRDYIIFRDEQYDADESEIVCRYPQFFASRLLRESIKESVRKGSQKGGTYFGATGCGKTYTMAMLARQLSLRCYEELGSPTVIMIVDRDDLQKQGMKVFSKCSEYLCLGEVTKVETRKHLRSELKARESGGFYICTIQKFCDREDDKIGLINNRRNIICFSDEAHRTQIEHTKRIKFSKDVDENLKATISKSFFDTLKEAFPKATFVGFTGTPIEATYQTFGAEIDRYTMNQAVADGITVPIKYHPRIARVLLDNDMVAKIECYYAACANAGSSEEDVKASMNAMSSMEIILSDPERLDRLAVDIHDHFTKCLDDDPTRPQKAMIACCNRQIAYTLLKKFEARYPEWFEERKKPDGLIATDEEMAELKEMPTIAMVSSVGKNDPAEMYNYLGGAANDVRNTRLDAAFKQDKSNLRIVIVVDMWITGFDVPCLAYLYNDKPLQRHLLIQTISRVNRKYPGKDFGLIVDYIGIRSNMLAAMKDYGGGDGTLEPSEDDILLATSIFRRMLGALKEQFPDKDISAFMDPNIPDTERYTLLAKTSEKIFASSKMLNMEAKEGKEIVKVPFVRYFLAYTDRMRKAYSICHPSGILSEEENALAQSFMAIAGFVRKSSGTSEVDATAMNSRVAKMVEEALRYNEVESILEDGEQEDIYGEDFLKRLAHVKAPATRLEMLIKLLKKQISAYGETNMTAAQKFKEMLEATIRRYHERRKSLSEEEAGEAQQEAVDAIIADAQKQAEEILAQMKADRESFRKMGLTFEEKAFYDILVNMRDTHNFEYGKDRLKDGVVINDKCSDLAKKIKAIIDEKSIYADWLNNQNVRNKLRLEILVCMTKNGFPPTYSPKVFDQVMEQVENYEQHHTAKTYDLSRSYDSAMVSEADNKYKG